jgi:hypothetical protein
MNPDPNAFRNDAEQQMGLLALDAFHRKDVGALKQLMDQGCIGYLSHPAPFSYLDNKSSQHNGPNGRRRPQE